MMRPLLLITTAMSLLACYGETKPSQSAPNTKAQWVALSGGCFNMGEERVYREERPVTHACIEPFEMWSHEVSNAEFAAFVKETGHKTRAEQGWKASDRDGPGVDVMPSSAVFVPPKNPKGVNWEDAQAYAKWAGGRLPSEAEWEYAARGGLNGELMSWAEAEEAALEDKANTWQGFFPVINSADDGYVGVAPIGSYPANGFGLYDMIGNVWEWTSSNYYPTHNPGEAAKVYPNGYDPAQGDIPVGVIKGGSFLCARSYCYRYRPAARQPQDLIFGTSHIGFRIVREVPS